MPPRKDRVKPTHYPILPFHILRSAQLISAIIVSGIMSYFLWQLHHDHYRLPWTFILLLVVSLLTVLFLTATIILHCFYGLNPLLNTCLNGVLLVLWALGFALLTWWTSGTLAHVCNVETWDDAEGITICRVYKALFSFALLGLVSTLLALLLDIHVQRKTTHRGKFTPLQNLDNKSQPQCYPHHDAHAQDSLAHLPLSNPEHDSNPNPTAARNNKNARGGDGYALPEEQFGYGYDNDTEYQGAEGEMGRRSLEDRI